MNDKDAVKAAFEIIEEYDRILKTAARRSFIVPESRLPHSKDVIKNAIRIALSRVDDEDKKDQLKSAYISLANFVSDDEAKGLENIPSGLFSFLEMDEHKKKEFLHNRFKSGLLGDYELAMKMTRKVTKGQIKLRKEIEKY